MLWKKPQGMKYTEMCMYIDANIPTIATPGKDQLVENTVYNYLWLLVKALAIKRHLFDNFKDYDPYCFYAAERLFFALRKNYNNQGKIIKGKEIRPIKSCLNYTKKILYAMKVEYQNQSYQTIIAEEWVSKKFDAFQFKEQMKEEAKQSHAVSRQFWQYVKDSLEHSDDILNNILQKSPFSYGTTDYKHLKMTIMLNCYYGIRNKGKLDQNPTTILTWKLPKSLTNYIRILLKEFYTELKKEIISCYEAVDIDDDMLEKIISDQGEYHEYEE